MKNKCLGNWSGSQSSVGFHFCQVFIWLTQLSFLHLLPLLPRLTMGIYSAARYLLLQLSSIPSSTGGGYKKHCEYKSKQYIAVYIAGLILFSQSKGVKHGRKEKRRRQEKRRKGDIRAMCFRQ